MLTLHIQVLLPHRTHILVHGECILRRAGFNRQAHMLYSMHVSVVAVESGGTNNPAALFPSDQPKPAHSNESSRAPRKVLPRSFVGVIETSKRFQLGDTSGLRMGVAAPGPLDPAQGVVFGAPNYPGGTSAAARLARSPLRLPGPARQRLQSRRPSASGACAPRRETLVYLRDWDGHWRGGPSSTGVYCLEPMAWPAEFGHMFGRPQRSPLRVRSAWSP